MNLRQAGNELLCHVRAGNAAILQSGSGLGKSDLLNQTFRKVKALEPNVRWGYGKIFAATQTPPDIIGFQFKGEKSYDVVTGDSDPHGNPIVVQKKVTITDPSVPLWMLSLPFDEDPGFKPAFMYDKFFLVIDEYGQGEADVKRAIAEIFLNGGTAPWYLPPGSVRVAATNQGARYGVTKDFDFCIARRSLLNIVGDVDVWVSDFADKPYMHQGRQWQVMPVTKAWALAHPEILFEAEPVKQGAWCNPRTLTAFDRYLQVKAEIEGEIKPDDPMLIEAGEGTIGMPATQSIIQHLQFRLELPSYETVCKDPAGTPVPQKADLLMLMAYELAGLTKKEHLAEVLTYVQRMPKDMAITYINATLRRDYRGLINEPPMQGYIKKNSALLAIIAGLAN
jgi:hypothetical protein